MFFHSVEAEVKHLFPLTCLLVILLFGGKYAHIPPGPAVPNDTSIASVDTIIVQPDTLVLADSGATRQFEAMMPGEDGEEIPDIDASWSSSDTMVATVSDEGVATAHREGRTEIQARTEGVIGTARLTVRFQRLPGDPDDPVAQHIPDREFEEPDSVDFSRTEGGNFISRRDIVLIFKKEITVREANELLESLGAKVKGGNSTAQLLYLEIPDQSLEAATRLLDSLNADQRIAAAALDQLGSKKGTMLPSHNARKSWRWDLKNRGNWGLHRIRAPQFWNLASLGSDNENCVANIEGHSPVVETDHPDLNFAPGTNDATNDHATMVSGIIGATQENNQGVEGMDPWLQHQYARPLGNFAVVAGGVVSMIVSNPCIRAFNYSWGHSSIVVGPDARKNNRHHAKVLKTAVDLAVKNGAGAPGGRFFLVAAAGNEDGKAKHDDPISFAASKHGGRYLSVAATTFSKNVWTDSDDGASVAAPGACVRSTEVSNGTNFDSVGAGGACPSRTKDSGSASLYGTNTGTSFAAPHVTGLITALWSLDPNLTITQMRTLITNPSYTVDTGSPARIDAFAAAMGIDQLQDNNRLQRGLVNVDDGTRDGNLRKKAFSDDLAPRKIHTADKDRGSDTIAMSDFRVYRDAWIQLHGKKEHKLLDGPDHHFKKDLNMDGCVGVYRATNAASPSCNENGITYEESLYPRYDFNGNGKIRAVEAQTKGNLPESALEPFKTDPDVDCKELNTPDGCLRDIDVMVQVWDGGPEKVVTESAAEEASGRCSPASGGWSKTDLLADRNGNGVIDYVQSFDLHGKVQGAQTLRQPEGLYHTSPTQKGLPEGAQSPFQGQAGKPFDPTGLVVRALNEEFIKCRGESSEPWEGGVTVPTSVSGGSSRTVDFLYQAQKKGQVGSKQVTDNRYLQVQAAPKLGEDIAMDLSFNSVERLRSTERDLEPFPKKKQLEIIWRDHPSPGSRVAGKDPAYWTSDQCLSVNAASHKDTEVHQKLQAEAERVFVEENGPEDGTPDVLIRKWRDLDGGKISIFAPIGSTFESPECNGGDVKARLLGAWIGVGGSAGPRSLKISAGAGAHTCRVTDMNQAFCWGSTGSGRLGHDKGARWQKVPAPVKGDLSFTQISSGHGYTCAITQEGKVYCWGSNHSGNLGVGEPGTYRTPTQIKGMNPNTEFVHISSSDARTCAVTKKGKGYCWGFNRLGSLGNGTTENSFTPTPVAGDIEFAQIEAGEFMSCGLDTNGTVYCWGKNLAHDPSFAQKQYQEHGECVDTSPYQKCKGKFKTPQRVPNAPSFTQIDMAGFTICGITSGKDVQCWGAAPEVVGTEKGRTVSPNPVGGDAEFSQVSVGYSSHACALSTKGTAYCWGENDEGQLGLGETDREVIGEPAKIEDLRFRQISAGETHTCGITTDGATYCWGSNYNGELGIGSTTSSSTPTRVKDMKED